MTEDKKRELRETAKNMLPDPIIVIGYMEHYIDLIAKLVVDLAESGIELPQEAQERLELLKSILKYGSVDFNNIDDPLESYKLPKSGELKKYTRAVQKRYLVAQMREGVFVE